MSEEDKKVYPTNGVIEVGDYRLKVKFFSEKDEKQTRTAAQMVKSRLNEMVKGYTDSINECAVMLLVQLMIENTELKSKLEYSVDKVTLQNIDDILKSVDDDSVQ